MKVSPAIAIARKIAGYRPPAEDTVCCRHCGARRKVRVPNAPYYCVRHMFYVHSHGVCPSFDPKPYEPPKPKKPLYTQEEMF